MSEIDEDFLDEAEFEELSEIAEKFDDNAAIETGWVKACQLSCQLKDKLTEVYGGLNDVAISGREKAIYWTSLKKIVSLNCSFITKFEETLASSNHKQNFNDSTVDAPSRGRKKQRPNQDENHETMKAYDRYKGRVMKQLLQLVSLPLNRIADSQVEAGELVATVMRASYKMIENSSINNLAKSGDLLGINFSILGCGIEKYNQSLNFCLKFIQLLQYKEQLAPLLSEIVAYIVAKHDQTPLIGDILKEIDRIDVRELSRDSSCPKAVSAFLISLSERCPKEIIPFLNHIFGYLEQDSYIMRNASLSIMSNLIMNYLHEKEDEKTLRDELLDTILAHIKDTTGFSRAKALGVWCTLCDNQKIPLSYIVPVTRAAVGRLLDKSCYVRKSAVKYLTSILSGNPYAPKLPLRVFVANYETEKVVLEKLLEEEKERLAKEDGLFETLSQGSQCTEETHSQTDEDAPFEPNNPINNQKNVAMAEESAVVAQQRKINYLQDAIAFTKLIHQAIPLTAEMLTSKNVTDAQEAINFFVHCYEFSIDEALMGFKKMIMLINVQEKSILEAVTAAYKRIFFESTRYDNKSNKESLIVSNFINFVQDATIGECLSLEILFSHFVANGDFTKELKDELWARFTGSKRNANIEDAIGAIQILGMLATSQPDIIKQNLHLCLQHGLSVNGCSEQESRLIRETCIAIRKCLPRKIEDQPKRPMRLARDDELFTRLETILVETLTNPECIHWFSLCDESMKVIFDMAESPDKIGASIHNRLAEELLKNSVQSNSLVNQENRNDSPDFVFQPSNTQTTTTSGGTTSTHISHNMELVDPMALARFIHFLGSLALDLAVFLEVHVLFEVKKRNAAADDFVNGNLSTHNISLTNNNRRRSLRYGGGGSNNKSMDDANLEEEIGLGGAEGEDAEMEFITNICDEEVVFGNNLLAKMSRIVIEVCTDPVRYPNIELKLSSCLALAKFMMVSAKYCNNHLRLLFTILERSKESHIKINLLVAISDLCIRFPNQLDAWTGKIFDCLQSEDVAVRRAALKILSRLVLSDVLKAKDQISTMANLIVDQDEQIASFSRHFFLELSKKLNAVYNVLPDIISRLSDSKNGIAEADFRIVMKFIFELIDKSQHIDRLVDKLCGRFMDTDDERHWSDLAYCLSLLKYNDKSMAKLCDKFDCYKDKLCIDSVKESITNAIAGYRKGQNLRDDMKALLDELELKITKSVEVAEEEAELTQQISMSQSQGELSMTEQDTPMDEDEDED